jgi:hypothetical protein
MFGYEDGGVVRALVEEGKIGRRSVAYGIPAKQEDDRLVK